MEVAPARGAVEDQRRGEGHAPDVPRADGAAAGGAWGLHHGGESREMRLDEKMMKMISGRRLTHPSEKYERQ